MGGMRYFVLVCAVLVLVSVGVDALSAQNNETPRNKHAWCILPYAWDGTANSMIMGEAATSQGYVVEYYIDSWLDFYPCITIPEAKDVYGSRAGTGMIWSHGHPTGHAIEAYPRTPAGLDSLWAHYDRYEANGFTGQLTAYDVGNSFAIFANYYGGVDQWSDCDNAIIDNECCYGGTFCGWNGARVSFGPPDSVDAYEIIANLQAIWEGLDGMRGKEDRVAGHAYLDANPQKLSMCGNGYTTLAPAVEDYYPPEGFSIDDDPVRAWVAFDTKMDISGDAEELVYGSAGAFVEDQRWIRGERDTLRFTLWSVEDNDECFAVLGDHITSGDTLKSEGGMALDGNLNPYGSDGEGPNRDAFGMLCDCWYDDPNFAAALGSRWAYVEGGDVVVGWHVEAEWETREYVVEAGNGDCWHEVGRVARGAVVAPDVYSLRVGAGYDLYRIVEIDKRSKRSLFRPMRVRDNAPPFLAGLLDRPAQPHRSTKIDKACRPSGPGGVLAGGPLSPEVPDWVFYGPDSLLAECAPAVSWFESKGYSVDLASATSPDYCALWEYLQVLKVSADSLGEAYPRVLIVGDANEGGEPEKNQVEVAYFFDPSGACFFGDSTICATEDMTVDFDYDNLGDMQVARLPLTHRWKVARAVENFLNRVDGSAPTDRALFTVGDVELEGNSPEGLPELMAGLISQFEANGFETRYMKDSDYDFEDMETRQLDMADSLNEGVDIVVNIGVVSSRWRLGGDFICEVCDPTWQMSWLDNSGPRPFVLFGPTCDLSDFDRDNPTYENPLAEQFLYNDPQKPSAVAWISQGRGNWKTYYMIFAEEFVTELFSGDAIDLLDCYWKAKHGCWVKYPEMRNYLRGLFYLGWPVTLRGTCTSRVDDEPTGPVLLKLMASPNPAASGVTLKFGLPQSGRVQIEVFDARGRRVIVLVDGRYDAGWQRTTWSGRNAAGERVAPGMYFARVTTDRQAATTKLILVR